LIHGAASVALGSIQMVPDAVALPINPTDYLNKGSLRPLLDKESISLVIATPVPAVQSKLYCIKQGRLACPIFP